MAYRNKTYVAFDADSDIRYYRLMTAWKQNDFTNFSFFDAHDLNNIWHQSSEETIKRRLRERMNSAKIFVILIGEKTKFLYKFVKWEIELALKLGLPIIVVNLNGKRAMDDEMCPPVLRDKLALHVSFNSRIIQKALEEWGGYHIRNLNSGKSGPFYYNDYAYKQVGL
ncbi:MAG: TIR domain-containing protein [Bacteroidia bacterium]|nr:TIR domain-containing protein [Bacteroidia bacterium]